MKSQAVLAAFLVFLAAPAAMALTTPQDDYAERIRERLPRRLQELQVQVLQGHHS